MAVAEAYGLLPACQREVERSRRGSFSPGVWSRGHSYFVGALLVLKPIAWNKSEQESLDAPRAMPGPDW
jgi:hypothetical protein